jgi:acetylornithine deacetylase
VDVVTLTSELVAIPSLTGEEGSVVEWVARWLAARDWAVVRQEVTPGRCNILATRGHHRSSQRTGWVTLSTHLDTVPPHIPPRIENGRVYGRGACDAKGIAAAMLVAADRLVSRDESRIALLFVVGEEQGSDGALAANTLDNASRYLINGEPTEGRLASAAKGSLRVTVRAEGREAHSAYPTLGRSAIETLIGRLAVLPGVRLPSDPVLGPTTINIGTIHGGTAANVIAGQARAELMIRVVGEVDAVKSALDTWAAGVVQLEYGAFIPAQHFDTLSGFETGPVAYTSDIPLLDRWGTPFLFGPGSIHLAHTPHESIGVDELHASVDTYERLVQALLTA